MGVLKLETRTAALGREATDSLLNRSEPHQRGFGTAERFQNDPGAIGPGPYTGGQELQLVTGFNPLVVCKATKAQSFSVTCKRFLMNEAIIASKQNLPDPNNPGPNRHASPCPCLPGGNPETCRACLQIHGQVPVRPLEPPGRYSPTKLESISWCDARVYSGPEAFWHAKVEPRTSFQARIAHGSADRVHTDLLPTPRPSPHVQAVPDRVRAAGACLQGMRAPVRRRLCTLAERVHQAGYLYAELTFAKSYYIITKLAKVGPPRSPRAGRGARAKRERERPVARGESPERGGKTKPVVV